VTALGWNLSVSLVISKPGGDKILYHRLAGRALSTVLQVLVEIAAIVETAMTIRVNHIDLSDSPISKSGQVLPLLLGVFVFCVTIGSGW
jgi:hypothetical protein